jgi:isopentenyldiphosphate isomerase
MAEERGTAGDAGELLDVVDHHDRVTGRADRAAVYAGGLCHRVAFVLVRDEEDRIFVHRRTDRKLIFPGLYTPFVGGVVGAGESYAAAALREAEEELGVSGLPRPVPLFRFLHRDGGPGRAGAPATDGGTGRAAPDGGAPAAGAGGSWWITVHEVRCALPVRPQPEEVASWEFLTAAEIERRLGEWAWAPDGLAAYARLRALGRGR